MQQDLAIPTYSWGQVKTCLVLSVLFCDVVLYIPGVFWKLEGTLCTVDIYWKLNHCNQFMCIFSLFFAVCRALRLLHLHPRHSWLEWYCYGVLSFMYSTVAYYFCACVLVAALILWFTLSLSHSVRACARVCVCVSLSLSLSFVLSCSPSLIPFQACCCPARHSHSKSPLLLILSLHSPSILFVTAPASTTILHGTITLDRPTTVSNIIIDDASAISTFTTQSCSQLFFLSCDRSEKAVQCCTRSWWTTTRHQRGRRKKWIWGSAEEAVRGSRPT